MNELSPFLGTLVGNIIIALGIITLISIIGFFKQKILAKTDYLTSLTVGLLLGIIFLGFFPEIIDHGEMPGKTLGLLVLSGLLLFYMLELFFHWHHCKEVGHTHTCGHGHQQEHQSHFLMFTGTFIHNAFHGFILFTAFSIDFHFGFITTLAILLHSIPQNIANYIMNHKKPKYAYIAAFGGVFGALLTFPIIDILIGFQFEILAIITGGLLYTALADIFPEFHGKSTAQQKLIYLAFIILGVVLFLGINSLSEHSHDHQEHEIHDEYDDDDDENHHQEKHDENEKHL